MPTFMLSSWNYCLCYRALKKNTSNYKASNKVISILIQHGSVEKKQFKALIKKKQFKALIKKSNLRL